MKAPEYETQYFAGLKGRMSNPLLYADQHRLQKEVERTDI
jgi:hypothetical protein